MPKYILSILLLLISVCSFAQPAKSVALCRQLNQLNTAVANGTVPRKAAAQKFNVLIEQIKAVSTFKSQNSWVFPLEGYKPNAIGGAHGNGYFDKGYNYLDGNKHTAHPAHDIFINDRNQDDLDDKTKQPINVLAVTKGIVLACSDEWDASSDLRGGKYIWLYHPSLNIITYYAHNHAILVKPGDIAEQGQKIAEVGRTGLNAYKKRSPTHLHFSAFKLVNGLPVPFDPYAKLIKAKLQ